MIPVILSGGSGTRLWPVSRVKMPKQFCDLFDNSLQNLSLERAEKLGTPLILTNQELKSLTEQNIKKMNSKAQALYEPMAQNTAPAIAYLCRYLELNGKNQEVISIFPSDHLIENETTFLSVIEQATEEAKKGFVVTLGIKPTFPSTGYGYIQLESQKLNAPHKVLRFLEKPALSAATHFVKSGTYFWNAGIFVFKVATMIELFKNLAPNIWKTAETIVNSDFLVSQPYTTETNTKKIDNKNLKNIYNQFPNISIDYAIMEKLSPDKLKCIPCDIGWSDVGSWDAVSSLFKSPHTDFLPVEVMSSNNYIHGLKQKIYATIGIHNLIIVDTADALLISQKGLTQEVKTAVDLLKKENHKAVREHIFEDRPWGRYEVLREENSFKSKVIHVLSQQQLSYQSHNHREEHWIITQGSGEITLNEEIIPINRGSYIKIPQQAKHRIKNTGTGILEFVEVQLGDYLGEDDIIRYQDEYQRE
ncbi:MAG: mannose-1-phosphate guanylyltransferase/mannose-6-phosphate isomerase [Bdellovibrionaceae bacterium]|nr:mannose-1-phosphate guanylyltransferase/mannose-6-phosphate isomerase [Pseudobdellovibrionaceae bacterium]